MPASSKYWKILKQRRQVWHKNLKIKSNVGWKQLSLKGEKKNGQKWNFICNHSLKQAGRTERPDMTEGENIRQPGQPTQAEEKLKWTKKEGTGVCELNRAGWRNQVVNLRKVLICLQRNKNLSALQKDKQLTPWKGRITCSDHYKPCEFPIQPWKQDLICHLNLPAQVHHRVVCSGMWIREIHRAGLTPTWFQLQFPFSGSYNVFCSTMTANAVPAGFVIPLRSWYKAPLQLFSTSECWWLLLFPTFCISLPKGGSTKTTTQRRKKIT